MEFKEGIFENLSFDEYASVDALNGSRIVNMRTSPMKYKYALDNPQEETYALKFGKLTHRLILEPRLPNDIAIWRPTEDMKVRRGKEWDKWAAAHVGKIVLTDKEHEDVMRVSVCALAHRPIGKYANADGPTEVSMFWIHPGNGRRFKARMDKLIPDGHIIFDLKTTRDCHSYKFGGQAYALGYHIKASLYVQGYQLLTGKRPEFRIGAIESKAPHESAVYRVTNDVIQQGWEELDDLVAKIINCEKTKRWPAEHEDETDLLLPTWAMNYESDIYDNATAA